MDRRRTWEGEGAPAEMWLLQLDIANHSKWTRDLHSYPDAFHFRREFARRVTATVTTIGFDRLVWAGDGGLFVAEGARNVDDAIRAAHLLHEVFEHWRAEVRGGDALGLRVSLHRARITTADDPAFCFGSELNDFMKYEFQLRDPDAARSVVVTGRIYEDLTFRQQQDWRQLNPAVGSLGPVFSFRPDAPVAPGADLALSWIAGAWHQVDAGSWGYAKVDDAGRPRFVYCYGADREHVGNYENWQCDGPDLVGTFAWVTAPISGRFRVTPSVRFDEMVGGWWYAEDLLEPTAPSYYTALMHPSRWVKRVGKVFPPWARKALGA